LIQDQLLGFTSRLWSFCRKTDGIPVFEAGLQQFSFFTLIPLPNAGKD
jgi:hypothetical protein